LADDMYVEGVRDSVRNEETIFCQKKIPAANRLITGVERAPAHPNAVLSAVCRAIGPRS
jgi:hypothetical protein